MSYTAAQVNTLFQAILQRPADLGAVQAFAGRPTDQDAQIRFQIETSTEAQTNVNPVVRLYQAAFNRLPDTDGLRANVQTFVNGYNANALATSFLAGPEAAAVFGSANPTVTAGFVGTVYQNALNRTGSATELSFWVNSGKSAGQVLAEIANSQEATSKTNVPVVSFLDAAATGALSGQPPAVAGSLYNQAPTNFTFTTDPNNIVGSQNNDAFTATGAQVNAGDTINGGGGIDSLTITGAPAGIPGTISNLEIITVDAATPGSLNFSNANGLQLATLRNATTLGGTLTVKAGVVAGLDNVVAAGGTQTVTYTGTGTFGSAAVANGTNVGTLNLDNAGITTLNILSVGSANNTARNAIGTLASTGTETTINVSGDRAITIGAIDTSVTTFNASANTAGVTVTLGAQNVAVTGGAGNDKFNFGTELNASDTVVGGAGTDTVSIATTDLTTASNVTLSALNTKVSGVEILEFTGNTSRIAGGTGATSFTNAEITKLLFNTAGLDVVDGAGSARVYAAGSGNGGDLQLDLLQGVNTVNVSVEGNAVDGSGAAASGVIGKLDVNLNAAAAAGSTATVNVNSIANTLTSGATNTNNVIGELDAAAGSTFKITGGVDLQVNALTAAGTIDATAFTGKLGLISAATGNTVVSLGSAGTLGTGGVTTGTGIDTITAVGGTNIINSGAGNDTVRGGTGIDTINGGAGADNLTGGAGNDVFIFTSRAETQGAGFADTNTTAANIDRITDFVGNGAAAGDTIRLGTGNNAFGTTLQFAGDTTATVTAVTVATAADFAALAAGVTGISGSTTGAGGVAQIVDVTVSAGALAGRYLIVNDQAAAISATADTFINITGVTGALNAQDFSFGA